jgi:hypothetical protein
VDDERYTTLGEFQIKKGWVAFGSNDTVFAIPSNRDMSEIIDQRLILSDDPKFRRFGVLDVLAMLFDAEFQPLSPLSVLRSEFKAERVGQSPRRSAVKIPLGGSLIPGELWTPPESSTSQYKIRKSSRIPFQLVDITLERASQAKIALEIKNYAWLRDRTFVSSLGTDASLAVRQEETRQRIEDTLQSNWRVWNWEYEGRTYRAFAEYAGTTNWLRGINDRSNVTVILRNRRGEEIRVPSSALSDDDWNWAREGRIWVSMNEQHQSQQYLLVEDKKDTLVFQQRDSDKTYPRRFDELKPEDQAWIVALRLARKVPDDLPQQPAKWMTFAPYVR